MGPELIQITSLPQLVPSRVCLSCDVCCRFPEEDSFLRPYFTAEEISRAIARGLDSTQFPESVGCQVSLVPNPSGEGYLCPAFDPSTHHCRIYDVRPLDCQIYPLALMWSQDRSEVLLGWDTKCPFSAQSGLRTEPAFPQSSALSPQPSVLGPAIRVYADQIASLIERGKTIETLVKNPRLIGPFQDDVVILRTLPRLTARLRGRHEASGEGRAVHASVLSSQSSIPSPSHLAPLTLDDRPLVEEALASTGWIGETPLATYAFAPHFIWREPFSYWWADIAGHVCLFAEYTDGIFMPLPPLGPGPIEEPLAQAVAFMKSRNKGSTVTRVENVPGELRPSLEALGYCLTPKDPDYLYGAVDLVKLAGDRYKSQRAACNRFTRSQRSRSEPYQSTQADACLALHRQWVAQQEARDPLVIGAVARQMLKDSAAAHREALLHHRELGLVGSVVWVDGAVGAYTFGFELTPSMFGILLEVADRSVPGLAQFIFRECCREAVARGYTLINTMDDSGLPSLARSKQAYHPCRLLSNYILSER